MDLAMRGVVLHADSPLSLPANHRPVEGTGRHVGAIAIALGSVFVAVLMTGYILAEQAPPYLRFLAVYVQYIPLCATAGAAMRFAATTDGLMPETRRALRWLSNGLFGMCVGMLLYIWSHHVGDQARGIPLFGDAAFLLAYLAIVIGLLTIPRRGPAGSEGWKAVLDAGMLVLGIGLLGWYFIARPTAVAATGPLDLAIRIAYPLLDVAFLFGLNRIILAGGPAECRRAFRWLTAAILMYVAAESLYQVMYYGPEEPEPLLERLSEAAFSLSYLFFLVAAVSFRRGPQRREPPLAIAAPMSPYSLIVTGMVPAIILVLALDTWTMPLSPLILGIVGLTILLLIRQWMTMAQNTQLLREQARRESDTRVAALVRHGSDLIIVANADGVLRFVSPSAERILGVPSRQLTGLKLRALLHGDDFAASDSLFSLHGGTATLVLRMGAMNQPWRDFEVVATDLTEEPAIQGIVLVARDLTDRNAMESRLRQSQKMEAVGRLAGGVAHDFNNLLTTILASTELVLERDLDTMSRADLLSIRQAAELAAGLTGQLLAFSRQDVTERRTVDLRTVVDDTVNLLRRILGQDIIVHVDAAAETFPIKGDANQLVQVIVNLALNARDAMPRGGDLSILLDQVRTDDGAGAGDFVTLTIRDSGSGMDEPTRARMFEPFFTTKAAGQGTGLGLATTARIIEQHGGTIAVDSVPGSGTTVVIKVPMAQGGGLAAARSTRNGIGPTGSEFIVLAEDEAPVRDVAERILTRLGYTVRTAIGADSALALLDELDEPPALLVTDVMMPGMTGPELAAVATARYPDLRVLFISGYPGDALQQLGIGADGVQLLQKPFTPRELADAVRAVLDASLASRPAE